MAMEPPALTPVLQQKLLQIIRATIETYLRTHAEAPVTVAEPELQTKCGAFVTLKTHGNLRGCIGMVEGFKPLYQTIIKWRWQPMTDRVSTRAGTRISRN